MSVSLMRSRSNRGMTSSIESPVNEASVTLARSEPEPFTHNTRTGYPRKSVSRDLAEVLPPPQLQTERSAPSLRERATSCARVVGAETSVIVISPSVRVACNVEREQASKNSHVMRRDSHYSS